MLWGEEEDVCVCVGLTWFPGWFSPRASAASLAPAAPHALAPRGQELVVEIQSSRLQERWRQHEQTFITGVEWSCWWTPRPQSTVGGFGLHSVVLCASFTNLGDLAEAGGVDGSVFGGDGHRVPALVLRLVLTAPGGVLAPTSPLPTSPSSSSTTSSSTTSTTSSVVSLGEELLLDFDLLPVFFLLCILVGLVDGLGALVSPPGNPGVLEEREREREGGERERGREGEREGEFFFRQGGSW